MNINLFLHRIGFNTLPEVSFQTLAAIQKACLLTIPFENLDIHKGISFDLSTEALFDKIVTRQRGGVCYESNGLLYEVLIQLDFSVDIIAAEMYPEEPLTEFYTQRISGAITASIKGWIVFCCTFSSMRIYPCSGEGGF